MGRPAVRLSYLLCLQALNDACLKKILFAGFTKAEPPNLTTDFGVYGVKGVMNGAAIIFFAYLGYDAVATLAEEVRPMTGNTSLQRN